MNRCTSILYAQPSFWEGFTRAVDFGGGLNHYNSSSSSAEADYAALLNDWRVVGDEIASAMASEHQKLVEVHTDVELARVQQRLVGGRVFQSRILREQRKQVEG